MGFLDEQFPPRFSHNFSIVQVFFFFKCLKSFSNMIKTCIFNQTLLHRLHRRNGDTIIKIGHVGK